MCSCLRGVSASPSARAVEQGQFNTVMEHAGYFDIVMDGTVDQ